MMKLKRIMKVQDSKVRLEQLEQLARDLGVSMTRYVDGYTGNPEEHTLVARIQEAYLVQVAQRNWIIALISGIASIISALVACLAIFLRKS